MISKNRIDILLSTYNGGPYLKEQLASIVSQDVTDWHIIVRDDSSDDDCVSIIKEFSSRYPDKITIISESKERLGVIGSYNLLLEHSNAPYVVFCDQDDVWLPNKLELLLDRIQKVEQVNGRGTPILIHSDLLVVNEELSLLDKSFWHYQKLNPTVMQSLRRLLVQNCVTGCATMVNESLVKFALPIPQSAIMHDWWFALLAVSLGKLEIVPTATVKYRQHAGNDTGAKKWDIRFIVSAIFKKRKHYREALQKTCIQAKALEESGDLDAEQREVVSQYAGLLECNWFRRRLVIMRMGFYKYGVIRNIALMLWI